MSDSADKASVPWWVLPSLAIVAEVIFAGGLVASCMLDVGELRTVMFTAAVTQALAASNYYFGSSAGSSKKDETIAANTAALATSSPAPVVTTTTTDAPAGSIKTVTQPA